MSTRGFWAILQPRKDLALLVATTGEAVLRISVVRNKPAQVENLDLCWPEYRWSNHPNHPIHKAVHKQIVEYFTQKRQVFDLPLQFGGSEFQKHVWRNLIRVPYGDLLSYGDLAAFIDKPRAARAVGGAVAKCEHLIVVPCHRVISGSGGIGGFGSELSVKRLLLQIEGHKF